MPSINWTEIKDDVPDLPVCQQMLKLSKVRRYVNPKGTSCVEFTLPNEDGATILKWFAISPDCYLRQFVGTFF